MRQAVRAVVAGMLSLAIAGLAGAAAPRADAAKLDYRHPGLRPSAAGRRECRG